MNKADFEELLLEELESYDEPEREYRFHDERLWRLDFAWPKQKVAVELEGGAWVQGRHTRGQGFLNDCEKYNSATTLGWKLIRIPTDWVGTGAVHTWLDPLLLDLD
jgi:very-short-patch-repair endonuclease